MLVLPCRLCSRLKRGRPQSSKRRRMVSLTHAMMSLALPPLYRLLLIVILSSHQLRGTPMCEWNEAGLIRSHLFPAIRTRRAFWLVIGRSRLVLLLAHVTSWTRRVRRTKDHQWSERLTKMNKQAKGWRLGIRCPSGGIRFAFNTSLRP
jgi:hypothetical protein